MKVCDVPPPHCASCYGQYTDMRHVDLEASYDGPVIEGGVVGPDGVVVNKIPVSIDELVLCETCLIEAAALIGMRPVDGLIDELRQRNQTQAEELLGLKAYVQQLEAAVATKPAASKATKRTKVAA